ncbi:MAG: Electron transfer flavoprotein subunit beta [Promethearchaeota archaeon]|nr:MAG: Electron transfer flavoprotein subunit beta [Candidatus Lokiarchaeota archaeon]
MKIFVCIKQVPGVSEVRIDPETNTLIREGIPSIINPMDKNAVELALEIKKKYGAETIGISMGPPQAEEALREALAMGLDEAYLLTDRAFAGADTLATSHTLYLGISTLLEKFKERDNYLVICGTQAIDGDTAQVGPELAEELGIPQITYVQKFELQDGKVIVERAFRGEEIVVIETKLPVLISVLKDVNEPRYPTLDGIVNSYEKEVKYLTHEDLKAKKQNIGLTGSQTEVWRIFVPKRKGEHLILEGSIEERVNQLCEKLREDKLI